MTVLNSIQVQVAVQALQRHRTDLSDDQIAEMLGVSVGQVAAAAEAPILAPGRIDVALILEFMEELGAVPEVDRHKDRADFERLRKEAIIDLHDMLNNLED